MAYTPVDLNALEERRKSLAHDLLPVMERMLEHETFTEISVERLVREARSVDGLGISRSSFYNHYEDKGDLLRVMVTEVLTALFQAASGWWSAGADLTEDALLDSLTPIAEMYTVHHRLIMATVETASYDARLDTTWSELIAAATGQVREHVRSGQRIGLVQSEVDAEFDPIWLTWGIERGLQQFGSAKPAQRPALLRALRDIIWRALYDSRV